MIFTIAEIKEIFSSSSAEALVYSSKTYMTLYVGLINEIPEEYDDCIMDLYDATSETIREIGPVDFEISINPKSN